MKRFITSLFITLAAGSLAAATTQAENTSAQDTIMKTTSMKEVKVSIPSTTRMKGSSMVTRVVASSLAEVGTAEDVLARIPGMMHMNGELQVIGKGAPVYYINGRKVHDLTELSRLSSHDIMDVEVISTPGSQYDAQTNAVVRIRTVRRKGEGLGLTFDGKDEVAPSNGDNMLGTTLNLNYRHNDVDVFGGFTYDNNHLASYATETTQQTFGANNFAQTGTTCLKQQNNTLKYNAGINWQMADNHSMGFRIERTDNVKHRTDFAMHDDVLRNNAVIDHLDSDTHTEGDAPNSWLGNLYYNGQAGKWGIDFNADYYSTHENTRAVTLEKDMSTLNTIEANNDAKNRLFAGKLVLSHPLWKGNLQMGAEVGFVKRDNLYAISEANINNDKSSVKENTYAAFAEYSKLFQKAGMLSLGVRYEHIDFKYKNEDPEGSTRGKSNTQTNEDLTRHINNIFPYISFATQVGDVQGSLSYAIKTRRPNYYLLRNNIEYNNRFTLSTGDPKLKNEIRHDVTLNARWKWLGMQLTYLCMKDAIYDWTYPYDNNGTVLISRVNFDEPIHQLSAFVNASPVLGVWRPSLTIGVQKQWLTFNLSDPRTATGMREVSYNKPMFVCNVDNTFRLPTRNEDGHGAWTLELNSELYSKAHYGNAELKNWFWNLTAAVQKSFLKDDALSVRLSYSDIFHTAYNDVSLDLGNYLLTQTHILGQGRGVYDLQRISLSVRYKFNTTKSKYKGTGAGNDMRQRM